MAKAEAVTLMNSNGAVDIDRRRALYHQDAAHSEAASWTPFGDGVLELVEAAEEAIVTKRARVVEEIIVHKDTVLHTETLRETLRRTAVEVEEVGAGEVGAETARL